MVSEEKAKKDNRVNVKLSPKTRAELESFGFFGESWEDIIIRLMKGQKKKDIKKGKPAYADKMKEIK